MNTTYGDILKVATEKISAGGSPTPSLDARLLLQHTLQCDHAQIICLQNQSAETEIAAQFLAFTKRRARGEPVHRILGRREFYGLELHLSPDTLEPRPETECLVDLVLRHLNDLKKQQKPVRFADLGTGSGALALTLLTQLTNSTCVATDKSVGAINTAIKNANALGLANRLSAKTGCWCEALDGKFDFIVSNPPYIPSCELFELDRDVAEHDPPLALDGGSDGLDAYREILSNAKRHLHSDGFIAVEIGYQQRSSVAAIGSQFGFSLEYVEKDLSNKDRCLLFTV